MHYRTHDIGELLKPVNLLDLQSHASAASATTATGGAYDRTDKDLQLSAKVMVPYNTDGSVSAGETLDITWKLQTADTTNSADFTDYEDNSGNVDQVTTVSTAAESGVGSANYDLDSAKKYVRVFVSLPANNNIGTAVNLNSVAVFGGVDYPPAN